MMGKGSQRTTTLYSYSGTEPARLTVATTPVPAAVTILTRQL